MTQFQYRPNRKECRPSRVDCLDFGEVYICVARMHTSSIPSIIRNHITDDRYDPESGLHMSQSPGPKMTHTYMDTRVKSCRQACEDPNTPTHTVQRDGPRIGCICITQYPSQGRYHMLLLLLKTRLIAYADLLITKVF